MSIYELRKYDISSTGLPYFRENYPKTNLPLYDKYGFDPIGFWHPLQGGPTLYLMFKWESLAEWEQKFAALRADEEWNKRRQEVWEERGIIEGMEAMFLRPTPYSPAQ